MAAGIVIGTLTLLHPVQEVLFKFLERRGAVSDPSGFLTRFHGINILLLTALAAALSAVPVIVSVAGWRGDDLTSRSWRALQPLRRDLALAVPDADIKVSAARSKTRMDLHRTDVAIRDAMLVLRSYFREVDPELVEHCHSLWRLVPGQQRYAEAALQLAAALAAREAGESPPHVRHPASWSRPRPRISTTTSPRSCGWRGGGRRPPASSRETASAASAGEPRIPGLRRPRLPEARRRRRDASRT